MFCDLDKPESEPLYETADQHFGEKELVDLTLAVLAINGWNRLAVSFRAAPGSYQPARMRAFGVEPGGGFNRCSKSRERRS
jgi:hypothetical protein